MGFSLKQFYDLCFKKFCLLTVMNIGINIIKNLEILHGSEFVHRDLKPDNLAFGPLCPENYDYRNDIGILDFGNAKILQKKMVL